MNDFNVQDYLRDMESRLMAAINDGRDESRTVTRELRADLESYGASFVVHEQRIIAVERTTSTVRYLSYATLAALGGLLMDVIRTKIQGMMQ